MGVNSVLEVFTTLFGWIMYESLWGILATTGVVWLPFLLIVLRHVVEARTAGADEGNAGQLSLRRIEVSVIVMLLVIVVAALPAVEVRLADVHYNRPAQNCDADPEVVSGDATDTTYDDAFFTLDGRVARIPLWWALLGAVSSGITSAAVAAIPCQADLRLQQRHTR